MIKSLQTQLPRRVRDRDVTHDLDGRVFVTLGYIQPPDRILSYLKYIPSPGGDWRSGETRYKRVFWGGTDSVVSGMTLVPARYLVNDTHFGTTLLELSRQDITNYFSPEQRLKEIIHEGPSDELETAASHIAEIVHDTIGIPINRLGVAGSISWKAHDPGRSDINMNVYGLSEAWRLQESYNEIVERNSCVRLRNARDRDASISRLIERLPRVSHDALEVVLARRRELVVDGRCIGIMPVLLPTQVPIQHGSEHYVSLTSDPVSAIMEISESRYGIFLPAVYEGSSKPTEATQGAPITRIMVYDGTFRGLLQPGDKVEVTGTLQRVQPHSKKRGSNNDEFYQIMLGTKNGYGKEFIRLI